MSAIDKLKEKKSNMLQGGNQSIVYKNGFTYGINEAIALLSKEPDPQKLQEEIERWKNYANELEGGIEKVNNECVKVKRKLEAENRRLEGQVYILSKFMGEKEAKDIIDKFEKEIQAIKNTKVADQTTEGARTAEYEPT